jgi:hypothetical protein
LQFRVVGVDFAEGLGIVNGVEILAEFRRWLVMCGGCNVEVRVAVRERVAEERLFRCRNVAVLLMSLTAFFEFWHLLGLYFELQRDRREI